MVSQKAPWHIGSYDYEMGHYRPWSLHFHLWPFLLLFINKIFFLLRISGFHTSAISSSFPFYLLLLFQLSHNLGYFPDLSFCLDHWSFLSTFVQSFPSQPLELRPACAPGSLRSLFFLFSCTFRSKAPELSSMTFPSALYFCSLFYLFHQFLIQEVSSGKSCVIFQTHPERAYVDQNYRP